MQIHYATYDILFDTLPVSAQTSDGRTALSATLDNGTLSVCVYTDFREEPLRLTAPHSEHTAVRLRVYPYRLELYADERLCDEEWPIGSFLMENATWSTPVIVRAFDEEKAPLPAVLGTFRNAEGWQPEENVFVGDCMPYSDGKRFHVIYLKDRHHHKSKWGYGAHQWAHISTDDFDSWQIHPLVVEIEAPWEGSICTGSHIEYAGKHYLYYTVRTCDGSPAPIMRSVSDDGYHYVKDTDFRFTLSERYCRVSARDPKVICGADGKLHMFLTTSLVSENKGCLAHLTSANGEVWTEEKEPIYIAPDEYQPECPDYFEHGGFYYLVFSRHGIGEYRYSDKPFSDWQMPKQPSIPCKTVPKMAKWGDKVVFVGFEGGEPGKYIYAGHMTFLTVDANGPELFPEA